MAEAQPLIDEAATAESPLRRKPRVCALTWCGSCAPPKRTASCARSRAPTRRRRCCRTSSSVSASSSRTTARGRSASRTGAARQRASRGCVMSLALTARSRHSFAARPMPRGRPHARKVAEMLGQPVARSAQAHARAVRWSRTGRARRGASRRSRNCRALNNSVRFARIMRARRAGGRRGFIRPSPARRLYHGSDVVNTAAQRVARRTRRTFAGPNADISMPSPPTSAREQAAARNGRRSPRTARTVGRPRKEPRPRIRRGPCGRSRRWTSPASSSAPPQSTRPSS